VTEKTGVAVALHLGSTWFESWLGNQPSGVRFFHVFLHCLKENATDCLFLNPFHTHHLYHLSIIFHVSSLRMLLNNLKLMKPNIMTRKIVYGDVANYIGRRLRKIEVAGTPF
jgi:hypothetical protein